VGAGVADGAGAGVAWVLGAGAGGDCASAALTSNKIAAGISATIARRKKRSKCIQVISKAASRRVVGGVVPPPIPVCGGEDAGMLAREARLRPMTEMSWSCCAVKGSAPDTLANPLSLAI
jgi:hypothetical protein